MHLNQLRKQTNKVHFLYVLILQFLYNSTCFERPFHSSSGVHDLLYLQLCTNHDLHALYTAAEYSKLWTPDDERNGRSKLVELYKICRINTYKKCILLVSLYKCSIDSTIKLLAFQQGFYSVILFKNYLLIYGNRRMKSHNSKEDDLCLYFNPLKTRRRPLYLKTQFVPRSKHFSSLL